MTKCRSRLMMTNLQRCFKTLMSCNYKQRRCVLGIETSCDDTGAAVVDDEGNVLGESLFSQKQIHLNHGGIIPPIARDLHSLHIERVVNEAMQRAKVKFQDLDAIATTVKPGLPLSLLVGLKYGKRISHRHSVPFIPIHHMKAHALTVRMVENVPFPFLVLLISGGHCLLCVARSEDEFLILGKCLDDAPGEAFDKIARRLKLTNIPECSGMSGGQAMEHLASSGNPLAFELTVPMNRRRDCHFSFAGLKNEATRCLLREERRFDVEADGVLPNVTDICASFQLAVAKQLMKRVQRAVVFCEIQRLLPPENMSLVISGGVACNSAIRNVLKQLCDSLSVRVICPPPHLCTDNGIMIAWNGVERLAAGVGGATDLDSVDIETRCPIGKDISDAVVAQDIKLSRFKIDLTRLRDV